ncbi:MAG TPA: hypothetical protein VIW29_09475, partial [Polyangiaceae bacterium]
SDANNCGSCGKVCSAANLTGRACVGSSCTGVCQSGFLNCNNNYGLDGCETNSNGSVDHCGGCSLACSSNHVTGRACSGGNCTGTCSGAWLDCDTDLRSNGCEKNGDTDATHCGACNNACQYGYCSGGDCLFTRWGTYTPGPSSENRGPSTAQGFAIPVSSTTTLKALGIRTGNVAGSVHVRLALYADTGGIPNGLLAQTGSLTAVVNGATEGPVPEISLAPGQYWLFMVSDATVRLTTLAITANWFSAPLTFGAYPTTLPPLTGAAVAEANFYIVTTP